MTEREAVNSQSAALLRKQEPRVAEYLVALGSCFRRSTYVLAAAAGALVLTGLAVPAATSSRAAARQLIVATSPQDRRFAPAFAEVDAWVAKKAFPGAVLAVGQHGRLLALKAFGRIDSSADSPPMPVDAIFDLASLTKVIGTTTAAEILYDRHQLDLDAPVVRYLPEFGETPGHDTITVRNLLSHSSGLKSADGVWRNAKDRQDLLRQIYATPATEPAGSAFAYRDTNIILVGEIVQRLTGQPLDRFLARNVFGPLGMKDTGFRPSRALLSRIAPTEQDDIFRHMLVRGVVHDENAYVMGGVAGHAGLFSTARDLSALAQLYLNQGSYRGKRLIKPSTIALFETPQNMPPGSSRALGWDTPTPGGFAGPLASPHAIIHTGFTGTSIYIDPDRDAFVIFLTNRVNPTRNNALIGQARPAIHTAVLSVLDGSDRKK
jgi:CubicO group peptidase (beta-lactamase class C family)